MLSRLTRAVIAAALVVLSSGCSTSIFRSVDLGEKSRITSIDAKQRVILAGTERSSEPNSTERNDGAKVERVRRFCAEPSPDVFSVVAQALSAGGTFGRGADPATLQVALNAAFSSAEQGSTIPRTQTVNMLRELMYRTCERYLSGGYNPLELSVQAVRDQRLMVSILAIEQLTGAVAAKPVVIGAQSTASSGSSGADAAVRLDDAYKDLQSKIATQAARQSEYTALEGEAKECSAIADAVAKKEEDKLNDALKAKRPKCETAASALSSAKSQRAAAAEHYASLKSVAESDGIPVSAGTTLMSPKADGGLDRTNSENIRAVADVVNDIVNQNFEQDEFLFFCLKVMAPADERQKSLSTFVGTNDILVETCIDYVSAGIETQTERQIAIKEANQIYSVRVAELFEKFWRRVGGANNKVDSVKLGAILATRSVWPACVKTSVSRADWDDCFGDRDMTSAMQRQLAGD